MSAAQTSTIPEAAAALSAESLTPTDLAELLTVFNSVTARVQESHERLRGEVARLSGELRDANAQLERSRRLAALGEMAAGIAHEIRNPLGSIALYARMLDEDLADREGERNTARKIARAVRGLDAIVQDVLSFAREMRLNPEWVDARELFDEAFESAGVGAIRVERADREARIPVQVWCDPVLMKQALVNLIRNAAEAIAEDSERGVIQVDAMREGRGAGARTCLRVRDTGPGISPEVLDRIFNPFFTTRKAGTGLGLAIVHRIVDAHAGSVNVGNSETPPGAIVEIRLPLAPVQDQLVRQHRGESSLRLAASSVSSTQAERAA